MMTTRFIFYFIYLHLPHRINMTERKGKNIYIYIYIITKIANLPGRTTKIVQNLM